MVLLRRSTTEIRVDLAEKTKEMKEILPLKAIAGKKIITLNNLKMAL
jgi:hypothetical protein